ncbi:MAG: HAMP domain-containing sensor histidine kinase [Burkholderiaceae bacterium]|nr:HAMP domain-containing sensor histidine kinase [Burkholderiaceae bacterium]
MSVRFKIALTIFITGALTALGVIATVLFAFERFEHETTYHRANAFLTRVGTTYNGMLDMQQRHPEEFAVFLRSLLFFEPDSQLYLLRADGSVIVSTSAMPLPPNYKVALNPVMQAMGPMPMPYVMGDDPERPGEDSGAIIAALPLTHAVIRPDQPVAGYLYLVCQKPIASEGRAEAFRSTFARPALASILAVVVLATLLTAWITATVTRPLRRLTEAVATVQRDGLTAGAATEAALVRAPDSFEFNSARDEFGQLASGFRAMLSTLRTQWEALRRLDHFRREGVSNLSHDLRSPLTATTACLETLDARWGADPTRAADRQLVEVALRNTRNAARLVQSLGDLAQLDEPEFKLHTEVLDAAELLDDIALRFAARAAKQGVELVAAPPEVDALPTVVALDIELFERAVANLIDNALKFCPAGGRITLAARRVPHGGGPAVSRVEVSVTDTGPGISAADIAHLFDRFYQSRHSVEPASSEGGKGLGLAIVKRIAELHGGGVSVTSTPGVVTTVTLSLPVG